MLVPYGGALLVAAFAGVVFAWRRGHQAPALLLAVGALGFCIGQRGIRIVDLGVALAAGVALGDAGGYGWLGRLCPGPGLAIGGASGGRHRKGDRGRRRGPAGGARRQTRAGPRPGDTRSWCGALLVAVLAAAAVLVRAAASASATGTMDLIAGLCLAVALAMAGLAIARPWRGLTVVVTCLLLALAAQAGITAVLAVGDAHVRILRQVAATPIRTAGEQILPASWDLGYMVGMVSGRHPAAHPQSINAATDVSGENDARIFWSPESAAAAEAARRNIRFLYLGDRDFSILEQSPEEDRFRVRRRLGVQMPTMSAGGVRGPLPLSIVSQLLIYRLIEQPDRMQAWKLFAETTDARTGERIRILELVEPPDPQRTFVYAIFDNPTPVVQETEVQLFHDGLDGAPDRRGARLRSRVPPWHSSMSIFSFVGLENGRARAELGNPVTQIRLLARQSGGHYQVDYVRPRRGWQPLE
jgi:hypothetical protein